MTSSDTGDLTGPPHGDAPTDPDFAALISRLRVDELMTEVQERFARISDSRRQLAGLMESMLAISSGLDLQDTLRSVVRSAMGLVEARYGAVGVRATTGGWPHSSTRVSTTRRARASVHSRGAPVCSEH